MKHKRKILLGSSTKVVKGEKEGYLTGIMYLAPFNTSGLNVCPHASVGCAAVCLYISGRGAFNSTQLARIEKTNYVTQNRKGFDHNIDLDIKALQRKAEREGLIPCVRLNGTSDLGFNPVYLRHPDVQFYDYTPNPHRYRKYLNGQLPANYHLTFSRKEDNDKEINELISIDRSASISIAACFTELPVTYKGLPVIDGDKTDLRFTDPKNVVVGLTFKGTKANRLAAIKSGFCVDSATDPDCK